ncbi:keratin-associated protein 19-2-like [Amphibalanus amphitrite]|uniref:keratin-associated protein 19-2-like n=1 Tax=Amphibalanus amphitrite TaxID=1232801 RepID=UPI001C90B2C0|nr:keratin-associated protein 19-2-like [Amphibalanus amphitrite]
MVIQYSYFQLAVLSLCAAAAVAAGGYGNAESHINVQTYNPWGSAKYGSHIVHPTYSGYGDGYGHGGFVGGYAQTYSEARGSGGYGHGGYGDEYAYGHSAKVGHGAGYGHQAGYGGYGHGAGYAGYGYGSGYGRGYGYH